MRQTGIFFMMVALFFELLLICHFALLELYASVMIISAAIILTIFACWYIDLGSRREYSGASINACNLPPGQYLIHHYGFYTTGAISMAIYFEGKWRLCFVEGYYLLGISWEEINVGQARVIIIEGYGYNKKYFICPELDQKI